ncbi:MAG: hypothetical protein K2Y05_09780, partial [Hyphomicrobiaceae bacterium]|nr:hypothetical protein [Hyphomicrobiaceae bacterium]
GGMSGVAKATVAAPASRMANAVTAPVRDAYREGAAAGYRATAPTGNGSSGGSSPSGAGPNGAGPSGTGSAGAGGGGPGSSGGPPSAPPPPPAWAQNLARRQRFTQAGMMAAQALREGDRPAGTSGPELKNKS